MSGAGALQETEEILEERVRAPQGDKNETIACGRESLRTLEVLPKVLHGLPAFVICATDREGELDLSSELLGFSASSFTNDQQIIGFPSEVLRLEVDFFYDSVNQDWWNPADQQLCEPVRR